MRHFTGLQLAWVFGHGLWLQPEQKSHARGRPAYLGNAGMRTLSASALDGLDHVLALEAQLDHLMQDVLVQHGRVGDGVCLHHRQVARQMQCEPGVLPARQGSWSAPSAS